MQNLKHIKNSIIEFIKGEIYFRNYLLKGKKNIYFISIYGKVQIETKF